MGATSTPHTERPAGARRIGYIAAAIVNLVILWVVHHLLEWGWPGFLTSDLERVMGWINLSLLCTAAVNLLWIVWDPRWFRHLAQAGLDAISFVVVVRTLQVYPFDFTGYPRFWEWAVDAFLVVGLVGTAVATVVELARVVPPERDRVMGG